MRILSLPSLQYRRRRGDLIFLYQILGNFYNIDKNKFFLQHFFLKEVITEKYSNLTRDVYLELPFLLSMIEILYSNQ